MAKLFAGLPDNLPKPQEPQKVEIPVELQGKSPEEIYTEMQKRNAEAQRQAELRFKAEQYDKSKQLTPTPPTTSPSFRPGHVQRGGGVLPPTPVQQYGQYHDPNPQEADLWTQPDKFMEQQFSKRLDPLVQSTMGALKETNKQVFQQRIGKEEWESYGEEIEQFISTLHPQIQADPRAYETAYNLVRANHIDDIAAKKAETIAEQRVRERLEKAGYDEAAIAQFLSSDSGQQAIQNQAVQTSQTPNPPQNPQSLFQPETGTLVKPQGGRHTSSNVQQQRKKLTPEQKKAAEAFGMSDEEYMQYAALNTDIVSAMGG